MVPMKSQNISCNTGDVLVECFSEYYAANAFEDPYKKWDSRYSCETSRISQRRTVNCVFQPWHNRRGWLRYQVRIPNELPEAGLRSPQVSNHGLTTSTQRCARGRKYLTTIVIVLEMSRGFSRKNYVQQGERGAKSLPTSCCSLDQSLPNTFFPLSPRFFTQKLAILLFRTCLTLFTIVLCICRESNCFCKQLPPDLCHQEFSKQSRSRFCSEMQSLEPLRCAEIPRPNSTSRNTTSEHCEPRFYEFNWTNGSQTETRSTKYHNEWISLIFPRVIRILYNCTLSNFPRV